MTWAFDFALLFYLASGVVFIIEPAVRKRIVTVLGFLLQGAGLALGIALISHGWAATGYPPMRNIHESLTLMAHCTIAFHLVQAAIVRLPVFKPLSGLAAALLMAWASSVGGPQEHTLPALQNSFWLSTHVLLSMAGYAAVLIAAFAALFQLMATPGIKRMTALFTACVLVSGGFAGLAVLILKKRQIVSFDGPGEIGIIVLATAFILGALLLPLLYGVFRKRVFSALEADNRLPVFTRWVAMVAFQLMTLAIITGSVWGDVAWGRYWGWDPKEVWALITWLSLLAYLHMRLPGSKWERFAPWALVIGFLTVLFNYFGVNYLLSGLHSYA